MTKVLKTTVDFLASYGFACVIFLFMLLLTFLGTIEQTSHGLFEVQKKYFESLFVIHWAFDLIPVPLPGVYLLLILFCINLVMGGIIRMRKGKNTFGNLIIHSGMVLLILGGGIKYWFAEDGHMTLAENESSSEFVSYFLWEIAITPVDGDGERTTYVINHDDFAHLASDQSVTFRHADLPFNLTIDGYEPNTEPQMAGPIIANQVRSVDGFFLHSKPLEKEAEFNIAGAYATVTDKDSGESQEAILWGVQMYPATFDVEGKTWAVDMRKKRYPLPFTITLDKFTHELHPRTQMARMFMSDVTKTEGSVEQAIKISMNEPLRHEGYTFYQASWQPADPQRGTPVKSTLAVVKDPADRIPLYSCIVITFGLVLHFCLKLSRHLRRENRRLETKEAIA
jgi:hypothetical protein